MLDSVTLPDGLRLVRRTPDFTADTVPDGLRRSHRLAAGVWGVVRVEAGTVTFVSEVDGESRVLGAGETQVVEPDTPHHVEPGDGVRFHVEMHRRPDANPGVAPGESARTHG